MRRSAARRLWVLAIGIMPSGMACVPMPQRPFDDRAWRSGSTAKRGRMAADLLASERLIGLPESDVRRVLGPPAVRWDKELYPLEGRSNLIAHYDTQDRVIRVVGSELPPAAESRPFDARHWRRAAPHERRAMARSLTTTHSQILAGEYRATVHRRLGRPAAAWVTLQYKLGGRSAGSGKNAKAAPRTYLFISLRKGRVVNATTASGT